jgi:membrane fusion protein, multidrug efflux system
MAHLKSMDLPEPIDREEAAPRPALRPAKGRWWIWFVVLGVLAVGIWYFRSARSKTPGENSNANAPGAPGGYGQNGGVAGFNPIVPVVVATAQHGDVPIYFTGLGTVTAFNTVTVHSRVDGQLVSVAFKEGQFVHQGDLLAQIDPRPFQVILEQAEGALAKDQAQRKDAEANFERFKLLFAEGVIPKQQMDTQQAQVGQFDGAIKTDQAMIDSAKLQLSFTHITAPISGRIGLRLVDAGNMVHASDAGGLLVITQLQPISVVFSLPQDQLPQVVAKLRTGGQLPVMAYDRDNTAKIASGTLASIDNQIDTTTGTYKLKATFSNDNNILFPNQFVNVHLLVDTKRNLTVVPVTAIERGPQGTYVYAVDHNNVAKIRSVTIAQSTDENAGLSTGVNPGDTVVIDGQDKLQDGTQVSPNFGTPRRATTPNAGNNPGNNLGLGAPNAPPNSNTQPSKGATR